MSHLLMNHVIIERKILFFMSIQITCLLREYIEPIKIHCNENVIFIYLFINSFGLEKFIQWYLWYYRRSGYLERLFSCKKLQHDWMPRNQWGDYCQSELEEERKEEGIQTY